MTTDQKFTLLLIVVTGIVIPLIVVLIRVSIKWTRLETTLNESLKVIHEDKVATDRRLRWLEENIWKRRQ